MKKSVIVINRNEIPIPFNAIKEGMNIRLYNSDRSVYKTSSGQTIFLTTTDAYLNNQKQLVFQNEKGEEIGIND